MKAWHWLGLICSFFAPSAVHAQIAVNDLAPQMKAVLVAETHRSAVVGAAQHSTTWIKHGCQSGSFTVQPTVKFWTKPVFNAEGAISSGLWSETVTANGCGITRLLNVVSAVQGPNAVMTGPLAPGDTAADPTLQRDASRFVFSAALLRAPGCQQAFIDDTVQVKKAVSEAAGPALNAPVRVEHWTVVACGHTIVTEVQFTKTTTGTDIVAHAL